MKNFMNFPARYGSYFWKTHPSQLPNMDKFSTIRPWSSPENRRFEKRLDDFSRNRSESPPGKLKFWKNNWMSFPGFSNKG